MYLIKAEYKGFLMITIMFSFAQKFTLKIVNEVNFFYLSFIL